MRRICLTLPTNRACSSTLSDTIEEAVYATEHFDVEVYLLVLDSSEPPAFAAHAQVIDAVPGTPNLVLVHLDEAAQRDFLRRVLDRADVADRDLILDLMLPADLSYGACTNRAFLIGGALGCESIHRRDSDSRYQVRNGAKVFPVHQELTSLGKRAGDASGGVSEIALDPAYADRPVVMVGSSFVGELSVDIGEIYHRDPDVYHDIVSLWAPVDWPDADKRELVDESFKGAGTEPFVRDHSTLAVVDPMRVDMCNISFHRIQEQIPLPPATNTIGSDYFLIHVVHDAALPGVLHNRNIVNFHTNERKTESGFLAYQLRLTKFFLSMLYFNFIYDRMAAAGGSLLDGQHRVRTAAIVEFVRDSARLDRADNVQRMDNLDRSYRRLGGKFTAVADILASRRPQLLSEARTDIENFARLIEAWEPLMRASKATSLVPALR